MASKGLEEFFPTTIALFRHYRCCVSPGILQSPLSFLEYILASSSSLPLGSMMATNGPTMHLVNSTSMVKHIWCVDGIVRRCVLHVLSTLTLALQCDSNLIKKRPALKEPFRRVCVGHLCSRPVEQDGLRVAISPLNRVSVGGDYASLVRQSSLSDVIKELTCTV